MSNVIIMSKLSFGCILNLMDVDWHLGHVAERGGAGRQIGAAVGL
jgi:hypothetical protein